MQQQPKKKQVGKCEQERKTSVPHVYDYSNRNSLLRHKRAKTTNRADISSAYTKIETMCGRFVEQYYNQCNSRQMCVFVANAANEIGNGEYL